MLRTEGSIHLKHYWVLLVLLHIALSRALLGGVARALLGGVDLLFAVLLSDDGAVDLLSRALFGGVDLLFAVLLCVDAVVLPRALLGGVGLVNAVPRALLGGVGITCKSKTAPKSPMFLSGVPRELGSPPGLVPSACVDALTAVFVASLSLSARGLLR